MSHLVTRVLLGGLVTYGVFCFAMFLFQRRLLYLPTQENVGEATERAKRSSLQPWLDENGGFLGWKRQHPSGTAAARVLVLHGNAGSALGRTYLQQLFQASHRSKAFDVFLLEYPGYGPRPGVPSEQSLVAAAVDGIERLDRESAAPILLVGESLGTAVAALAAAERPEVVDALLLITPLKSVPDVARRHFPLVPSFLARDTLRADQALKRLKLPVAFLIAENDEVAFPDLGMEMYNDYGGAKRIWLETGATHNEIDYSPGRALWNEMVAFLMR